MNFRIVGTPLDAPLSWPPAREGGLAAGIHDALVATAGIEEQLSLLRDPDTVVVTTGQQPGLFSGPLYSIYKALSAAALARLLSARWHRNVVPLFWLAGDDHDFAEANHTAVLAGDGSLTHIKLRDRPPEDPLTPMSGEILGPDISQALAELTQALPDSDFRPGVIELLERHYRSDATVAQAFAGTMAELLAPFGIVCFDSTHPAAKRAMAPTLAKALGLSQDLARDLMAHHQALIEAGHDPHVHVTDDATLVMVESTQGRDRLMIEGDRLVTRRAGESRSLDDATNLLAEQPERFSPNVLLRPVVESAILPTVAYVAGPGELRYLPLCDPVYQRLRVHQQQPLPRWSGMVVEPKVERTLTKFEATLEELLAPNELEGRVAHGNLPDDAVEALADLRREVAGSFDILGQVGNQIDPTLEKPITGARRQLEKTIDHVESRITGHLKKNDATAMRQIAQAREVLLPDGKPQERVLTVVSFLSRHGENLLHEVSREIGEWYQKALEGDDHHR